jgi:hypothetical protein
MRRKMKLCKIYSCIQCPSYDSHRCYEVDGVWGKWIENKNTVPFPDWCPLKDYKE